MGLLSKFGGTSGSNSTSDGQTGNNSGIIGNVSRNVADGDELVYRYEYDITSKSVLNVQVGQLACFYVNGKLEDVFDPAINGGRHELETANLPGIGRILNLSSGGETTHKATVYFVSKTERKNMRFGAGDISIHDPYLDSLVSFQIQGHFAFRISNAPLFIETFVSTLHHVSDDIIWEQMSTDILKTVPSVLHQYMSDHSIGIDQIRSRTHIDQISNLSLDAVSKDFYTRGVELTQINILNINVDQEELQVIKEAQREAKKISILAEGKRKEFEIMGGYYDKQRQYDILEKASANEGAGTFMGAGMGLGMGATMGNAMGTMMSNQMGGALNQMAPPPPPPQQSFYMAANGQTTGPFTIDQIRQGIQSNQVTHQTLLCAVGAQQWIEAGQIPVLASLFQMAPPPPPPPMP